MELNIEIKTVELSNGLKVINLLRVPIHFEDGTIVPVTNFRLRLATLKRKVEPENADEWRKEAAFDADKIALVKANTVPRVEDLEWIKTNIPKDVLILCPRAQSTTYGFPFVTPNYANRIDDDIIEHKIDSFLWS
jgi:hypothetical protein